MAEKTGRESSRDVVSGRRAREAQGHAVWPGYSRLGDYVKSWVELLRKHSPIQCLGTAARGSVGARSQGRFCDV